MIMHKITILKYLDKKGRIRIRIKAFFSRVRSGSSSSGSASLLKLCLNSALDAHSDNRARALSAICPQAKFKPFNLINKIS